MAAGLQDPRKLAWWHNFYLGTTIFFFITSSLFAGLFGGYYSAWKNRSPCTGGRWVFGNRTVFKNACHIVGNDGLYAIEGATCSNACETWWHAHHPVYTTKRRQLQDLESETAAKYCDFEYGTTDKNEYNTCLNDQESQNEYENADN